MLLKNLMEEKQLNFNRPLLSVRRFTSGEPIENESKRKNDNPLPDMPRPPRYKSELKSGPVTHPGTVPFLWETIPGKPRDETKPQVKTVERRPIAPNLPPGRALKAHQQCPNQASANPSVDKNQVGRIFHGDIERIGRLEDAKVEAESFSSGNDDGAYIDACETLSRIESFSLNCSVSGLSGFDGLDISSGNSLTDQQNRDFMMGRFLPAAKAMASETTSQHAPWRPPIVRQQPKKVQEEISGDKQARLRYRSNFVPDYSQCHGIRDEESDDGCDEQEIFPDQVCGSLPRFGLKGSFCLLDPLPGMSAHTRSPTTPLSTKQATSSSSGSWSEFDNEQYRLDTSGQRSEGGFQMIKPQVYNKDAKNGKIEGISSYGRLELGGVSSGSDSVNHASQKFEELLADQNKSKEIGIPMVEKTLYVDTVHKVKSCPLKRQSEIKENEDKVLSDTIEQNPVSETSRNDMEKLSIAAKASIVQSDIQTTPAKREKKLESYSEFLIPTPLPKSPTDSWLGRTLPTLSAKNASRNQHLGIGVAPKYQLSKPKSSNPKWETIVKTTNKQHQHLRFSEERLTPISET